MADVGGLRRGFGTFAAGFLKVCWLWRIGYTIVAGSHVYI